MERHALADLSAEADRQILADGAGAEQAVATRCSPLNCSWWSRRCSSNVTVVLPRVLLTRSSAARFILLRLSERQIPTRVYGDDDEGFAWRLGPEPLRTVRDHLGILGALTGCGTARQRGTTTWTSEWLEQSPLTWRRARDSRVLGAGVLGDSHYAPDGGVVVLRAGTRRAVMDVGPLGYLSIAAHGHADALSVTFSIDGQDVIGDPGAGSYYGHPDWRRIHRGTRVHATV